MKSPISMPFLSPPFAVLQREVQANELKASLLLTTIPTTLLFSVIPFNMFLILHLWNLEMMNDLIITYFRRDRSHYMTLHNNNQNMYELYQASSMSGFD